MTEKATGAKKKAATETISKADPGQEIEIAGTAEERKRAQMALHQWARRHGLKLKTRNLAGRLIAWTEGPPAPYEL